MPTYTQQKRLMAVTTPVGRDVLLIQDLIGHEAISTLFHYKLDLVAENTASVPFDKLLGQKVSVSLELPDARDQRYFSGICNRVVRGGRGPELTHYHLEIVPQFWLLTRKVQSRIFQHMTIPDILKKVLTGLDVSWEFQGQYFPRNYCVQYRESDFNFASRLMEEEGIHYYFKHSADSHQMVVTDNSMVHPDLPFANKIIYETLLGEYRDEDRIDKWEKTQELRSGKFTLWDHCFELPHKHLEAEKIILDSVQVGTMNHKLKTGGNDKLEVYDYPGAYAQRFDGIDKGGGEQPAELQKIFQDNKRTCEIGMQSDGETPTVVIQGQSNCRHFVSGYKFTLERHFSDNGPYLLVGVDHACHQDLQYRASAAGTGGETNYSNTFTCIPNAVPYRPARVAAKPTVKGAQTAVVVGPSGEEIFTDKYGRIKVQFHWDREGKNDADSSCWVRVGSFWAGKRWGGIHIPRIGQEVIVDFLEGDPDRPICVGSVYNADQMPPWKLPGHKTQSGTKSRSSKGGSPSNFNELRFEDLKGKELVYFHAEKDKLEEVENDSHEWVGNDRHRKVDRHQYELVKKEKHGHVEDKQFRLVDQDNHVHLKQNDFTLVDQNRHAHVKASDYTVVGADRNHHVKGSEFLLVDGDLHEHVKGSRNAQTDGTVSLTVGSNLQEKVGQNAAIESGMQVHIKAGMTVVIEAGVQLSLKGPGGFVDINPAGVTIQGTMVLINSGGAAGSGSGSSPTSPTDAKDAQDAQDAKDPKLISDPNTDNG